jgi:hypothetical protein
VPLKQLPDEWQAAVKGLKPGDVSQPFGANEGWRIVKLLQVTEPQPASLDDPDTRERVYQRIRMERAKTPHELLQEAIGSGAYRVVIRWPKYKSMERQFAPPPQIPGVGAPGPAEPGPGPGAGGPESPEAPPPGGDDPQGAGPGASGAP